MSLFKRFEQQNQKLIEDFMLHAEDGDKINIVQPAESLLGKLPFFDELASESKAHSVVYQKRQHSDSISIINKDGEYETTLWETTPENIQTALRAGLFEAEALEQSPIAQIIADYGKYNAITLKRQIERKGLTSDRYNEKTFIVKTAQDAIFKLQNLWESVNNYDEALTPAENIRNILKKLDELEADIETIKIDEDDEYRKILRHIIKTDNINLTKNLRNAIKNQFCDLQQKITETKTITEFDETGRQKVVTVNIDIPLERIPTDKLEFNANIQPEKVRSLFSRVADANPLSGCIMQLIREQIDFINSAANKANNEISPPWGRGDLFTCIKRAEIHARKMNENPDYHDSAPSELSLYFSKLVKKGELITIDLKKHGAKVESKADLTFQTTVLENIEMTGQCLFEFPDDAKLQSSSTIETPTIQQSSASLPEVKKHEESKDVDQATVPKLAPSNPTSKNQYKVEKRKQKFWGMNWGDWSWSEVGRTAVRFLSAVFGAAPDLIYTGLNLASLGLISKIYNAEEKGFVSEKIERKLLGQDQREEPYISGTNNFVIEQSKKSVPQSVWRILIEKSKNLFNRLKRSIQQDPREKPYKNQFEKTIMRDDFTHFTQRSVFSGINSFVMEQLKKLVAQPVWEIVVETPKNLFNSLKRIKYDWTIGTEPISDTEISFLLKEKSDKAAVEAERQKEDIEAFIQEFNRISEDNPAYFMNLRHKAEEKLRSGNDVILAEPKKAATYAELAAALKELAKKNKNKRFAKTARYLHPDKPCDAVSSASEGYQILFEVFSDEIYKMHPVCGMGFTTLGLLGGLPFVAASLPAHIPAISAFLKNLSLPIAKALVGHQSGFMAGFSTALIEGKIAFCVIDTLKRGPNSFFVDGLIKGVAKNPITAALAAGFAVGTGYLIAFKLDIPWLSEKIADEGQGTFPAPELGFAGAKLAALVAEGLIDLSENEGEQYALSRLERLRQELKKELTAAYLDRFKKKENELQEADFQKIEEATDEYMKWVNENRTQEDIIEFVNNYRKTIRDQRIVQEQAVIESQNRLVTTEQLTREFCTETEIRFQDELNRARLNRLDVKKLSEEEKYKLYQWVQQKYRDSDPEYVAAVRAKLYSQSKTSPVATSFRIAFAYFPDLIRLLSSVVQVAAYGIHYLVTGEKFFEFQHSFFSLVARGMDFSNKVLGDLGLVARAVQKILKSTYIMVSALLLSASTVVVGAVALIGAAVESLLLRPIAKLIFTNMLKNTAAKIRAAYNKYMYMDRPNIDAELSEDSEEKTIALAPSTTFHAFKYTLNTMKIAGSSAIPALILFSSVVIVGGLLLIPAVIELLVRSAASLVTNAMAWMFSHIGRDEVGAKLKALQPTTIFPISALGNPLNSIKSAWGFLNQPNLGIRLLERFIGGLRKGATQKDIELASKDIDKRKVKAMDQKYKGLFVTKKADEKKAESKRSEPIAPSISSVATAHMLLETTVDKPTSLPEVAAKHEFSGAQEEHKHTESENSTLHEKKVLHQVEDEQTLIANDQKLFAILQKHANEFKRKFHYQDSVTRFFGEALHAVKKKQAGVILRAITTTDSKEDKPFSCAINRIKDAIIEVNKMRFEICKDSQGAFEQQLNDGLMALSNSVNNDYGLEATDRVKILEKVRELIQLNRHEHVFEIKSAFKEFLVIDMTTMVHGEDQQAIKELNNLGIIQGRIKNLRFNSDDTIKSADIKLILEAIKGLKKGKLDGTNMHMLAKSTAHDYEVEKKRYSFYARHISSDTPLKLRMRDEIQVAYKHLWLGLTRLSKHFASDPVMSREIMECYNLLPVKLSKEDVSVNVPVTDSSKSSERTLGEPVSQGFSIT